MELNFVKERILEMLEQATEEQLRIIWFYVRTLLYG